MTIMPSSRAIELLVGVALLVVTTTVLMTSSALAVTCDDVRSLSKAEQNYWSKRLNLTREQRHRIWLECYSQLRPSDSESKGTQPVAIRQ